MSERERELEWVRERVRERERARERERERAERGDDWVSYWVIWHWRNLGIDTGLIVHLEKT